MSLVKRDPFARYEIHREREYDLAGKTCAECGNVNTTKNGKKYLYRYRVEPDSVSRRTFEISELFCSENCRKIYHM